MTEPPGSAPATDFRALFAAGPAPILVLAPDAPRFTITEVNDAYLAATARTREGLFGRAVFEAFPDNPNDADATGVANLRASLTRVLATKRPDKMPVQRYDIPRPEGGFETRWWEPVNTPVLGEDGAVVAVLHHVADATERVRAAAELRSQATRQDFRLALEERLHHLADPVAMMEAATEALGRHLGVAQVGFGEIDEAQQHVVVQRDWNDGRIASVVGRWRMDDFGPAFVAEMKAGATVAIPDVRQDRRTRDPEVAAAYGDIGTRAILDVPLVRAGRMRAVLFVHHSEPRAWSDDEVALVEETCARLWSAVERARAETATRLGEARQTFLLALGDRIRELGDPTEVTVVAAQMLGRHLGVARAGYGEIDATGEAIRVDRDWSDRLPSLAGEARLLDGFGAAIAAELRAGRILQVEDSLSDPRIAGEGVAETWASIGLRAIIAIPLVKEGRFIAFLYLHEPEPRAWTDAEATLARDVAERTWAVVERARAEAALRDLNETLEERVGERTAELVQAQEALRQSQKLEAMGSLTGGISHDFNNLLTPIIGSLDLLQRKGVGGEREQRLIDGALQSAERAKTLVQRLLAFARRQPLQPKPVDVGALVAGMADLVASTSGPQTKVVVDVAHDLPAAVADANQLEMALLNLSVNARDAMPEGGRLTITARAEDVGPRHRSGLKAGCYVSLSVADTGCGMDEETLTRAVEPFYSTKGIGRGTGLGLSMVHGLAAQLGGGLTINSKPGLGTNVQVWLPASEADAKAPLAADNEAPHAAVGTALLVDDEELVRASTADMLADLGYVVIEAGSAEEALRLIDGGLRFDLLVTDHLMPGMTGNELARKVRGSWPDLRVLIISGYAEAEGVAPDLARLVKPFRQFDLAAKLSKMKDANTG